MQLSQPSPRERWWRSWKGRIGRKKESWKGTQGDKEEEGEGKKQDKFGVLKVGEYLDGQRILGSTELNL